MQTPKENQENMEKLRALFESYELGLPYIPESLLGKLEEIDESLFATCEVKENIYDIEEYLTRILSEPQEDSLIVGLSGHGVNSWSLHYYLNYGPLALYFQLGLNLGGYQDTEYIKQRNASYLEAIGLYVKAADFASANNILPKDQRMLVLESDIVGSGYTWIKGHPGWIDPDSWESKGPTLVNALIQLQITSA